MKQGVRITAILFAIVLFNTGFMGMLPNRASEVTVIQKVPIRPTPKATSTVTDEAIIGAQIKLVVTESVGNEWAIIQWQDPFSEEWYTVEGWQGTLDSDGIQIWWVGPEQFGKGPFRWLVFASQGADLLQISDEFTMPTQNKEVVTVTVSTSPDQ